MNVTFNNYGYQTPEREYSGQSRGYMGFATTASSIIHVSSDTYSVNMKEGQAPKLVHNNIEKIGISQNDYSHDFAKALGEFANRNQSTAAFSASFAGSAPSLNPLAR